MKRVREMPTESAQDSVHVVALRNSPGLELFDLEYVGALLRSGVGADVAAGLMFVSYRVAHLVLENESGMLMLRQLKSWIVVS
jgi:hypothetical protein